MKPLKEALGRFDDLAKKLESLRQTTTGLAHRFGLEPDAQAWVTEASAAIADYFPHGHEVVRHCREVVERKPTKENLSSESYAKLIQLSGVFAAAHNIIKAGYLTTLADAIRVTNEDEILDQASDLLNRTYVAAAAVLAGGALEMHLRGLCIRENLQLPANPSIAAYDQVIGMARTAGATIYGKPESSSVISWGQTRNAAAHSPGTFHPQPAEVQLMIDGIRLFLSKTTP